MVAFSGVAMANTAEVKELTALNNKVQTFVIEEQATPCQDLAIDIYEREIGSGDDDLTLLNDLMSMCQLN